MDEHGLPRRLSSHNNGCPLAPSSDVLPPPQEREQQRPVTEVVSEQCESARRRQGGAGEFADGNNAGVVLSATWRGMRRTSPE